jgi:phasin family protein
MNVNVQEFVAERGELLVGQVRKMRETSVESVREAFSGSAETLKALKSPVRTIARSGVKLTTVSQVTVQNLIELQSDVVTAALNDVAVRLERATRAENIIEFVREQIELTPATRARVVEDASRAVSIFKTAGRDFRNVAKHAYVSIVEKARTAS